MRSPRSLVLLGLVVAVVVAVFVLRGTDDETDKPEVSPAATPTATPSPTSSGTSPDEFCAAFRSFADAHGSHLAMNDDASGAALVAAADELIGLGRPIGLPMEGWLSLIDLVNGAIADVDGAVPHPSPDDAAGATPDDQARDVYLASACPA